MMLAVQGADRARGWGDRKETLRGESAEKMRKIEMRKGKMRSIKKESGESSRL